MFDKYYFGRSKNITDESVNEYLESNRMKYIELMNEVERYLRKNPQIELSDKYTANVMYVLDKMKKPKANTLNERTLRQVIDFFLSVLKKEAIYTNADRNPVEVMYELMNECHEKYYENFKNGLIEEVLKVNKKMTDNIILDPKTEQTGEENRIDSEQKDTTLNIEQRFSQKSSSSGQKQLINDLHKDMLKIYDDSKAIGYTPSIFRQMVANEGGVKTAKKLINSKQLSDGFAELAQLERLDLTVEALILEKKYRPLFSEEELYIARNRLEQLGHEIVNVSTNDYKLPSLDSNGRVREYDYYTDKLKGRVIYEHLFNNQTHRWMDINILGKTGNTNGRDSANILYYLGMRADYRGIFESKSVYEAVEILQTKGTEYDVIVRLLKLYSQSEELYEVVKSDIDSQKVEEGNGIEGAKKAYLVNKYERDPKNRKNAIEIHGLNCSACNFNFQEVYGERGTDFIEIHHIKPLSTLEHAIRVNPQTDLVPLCANCHRMVHRRADNVLSIESLKELIVNNLKED